jgi:hypothetical protein
MHPTIGYELAQARIADLHRDAQHEGLARAAVRSSSRTPQPSKRRIRVSLRWLGHQGAAGLTTPGSAPWSR